MSIVLEIADGAGGVQSGIGLATQLAATATTATSTFVAPNLINFTGTAIPTGVTNGDVIRIRGTTLNDGTYTVESRVSGTQIRVAEDSIVAESIVTSLIFIYVRDSTNPYTGASGLTIESFYLNPLRVNFTGVNFKSYPVQKNDRLYIENSGGGAGASPQVGNDGSWRVHKVRGPTLLEIDTGCKGTTTLLKRDGLSKGTGKLRLGAWNVKCIDETSITMPKIMFEGVGPGSADGHDFIESFYVADLMAYKYLGIQQIEMFHSSNNNPFTFSSKQELLLNSQILPWPLEDAVASTHSYKATSFRSNNTTIADKVFLGEEGVDVPASRKGSAVIGFHPNAPNTGFDTSTTNIFGSLVYAGAGQMGTGGGSKIYNTLLYNATLNTPTAATGGCDVQNVALFPKRISFIVAGASGSFDDVMIGSGSLISTISTLSSDLTAANLRISDDVFTALPGGVFQALGTFIFNILDPYEDYEMSTLASSGFIQKQYTYNPRFVTRDDSGLSPNPIQNLDVRIYSIDSGGNEVSVFTGVTDVNGRLNSGSGVLLVRQDNDVTLGTLGGVETFSHRILCSKSNFQFVNQIFTITQKSVFDFPILFQRTDFEGKYSF